jgi:hypothetical protein
VFLGFQQKHDCLDKKSAPSAAAAFFSQFSSVPPDEVDPFPASLIATATFATAFLRNCHFTINNTISHPFLLTIEIVSDIG